MNDELAIPSNRAVRFQLLGTVEAYAGGSGASLDLGPDHERCLLVFLLSAGGRSVGRDRLVQTVWDGRDVAEDAVWRLVARLRRRLEDAGLTKALVTNRGTYRLDVASEQVDLHRFRALSARGRALIGEDDRRAGELLEEALRLHRGVPLSGLNGGWIDSYRHTITEEYHVAETALYELAIRLGKPREVVPGLANLHHERPSDESVAWLYMHALYRSGRQSDALAVFREVNEHLDKTIATESLKALADLHQRMLSGDPGLMEPDAVSFPFGGPDPEAPPVGGHAQEPEEDSANGDEAPEVEPSHGGVSITTGSVGNFNRFEAPVTVHRDLNFNA